MFDDTQFGKQTFSYILIHSFDNTYLLSFLHMPGTFLGNEKTAGAKIGGVSDSRS